MVVAGQCSIVSAHTASGYEPLYSLLILPTDGGKVNRGMFPEAVASAPFCLFVFCHRYSVRGHEKRPQMLQRKESGAMRQAEYSYMPVLL